MPLPTPAPRQLAHTRKVTFRGYQRDDGLWDIEGELHDSKSHELVIPNERTWAPGETIHGMTIRVTIDRQMVVQAIDVAMDDVPHGECPKTMVPMQNMVGATMGPGWRQAIEKHLGGVQGCAHLRELLFNMATAAFQTLPGGLSKADPSRPPLHLGKCLTWDFNGPLVEKLYPVHFQKGPVPKPPKAPETPTLG